MVVNTRSRKGDRLFCRARDMQVRRGAPPIPYYPSEVSVRFRDMVRETVERGCKLMIVGGGDETINSLDNYFAYQDIVFSHR